MPTLIIKRPSHLVEHYRLGRPNVTIGPSELHDIGINDPVQAEIYYADGRYYLRSVGGDGSPPTLTYNGESVTEPVALADKGQIRAGTTIIAFDETGRRGEVTGTASFAGADEVPNVAGSAGRRARRNVARAAGGGGSVGWPGGEAVGLAPLLEHEADLSWLVPAILRRAAASFEHAGHMRDAAQCLIEAGEEDGAIRIFLQLNEHPRAAPLLLSQKRYGEALASYRAWVEEAGSADIVTRMTALLGVAACLVLSGEEAAQARRAYRRARELVENAGEEPRHTRARGWKALGDYGALVGRDDIVQLAYERALVLYGEPYKEERLRLASAYLKAADGNRLLVAQIEQQVAEWTQPSQEAATVEGDWERYIEGGARFGEWELWLTTAKIILLMHKLSGTHIEFRADLAGRLLWGRLLGIRTPVVGENPAGSANQFLWEKERYMLISPDGTETMWGSGMKLDEYLDKTPQRTLAAGPARIGNYSIRCWPDRLLLTNLVERITITIIPNSPQFLLTDREGRTTTHGR